MSKAQPVAVTHSLDMRVHTPKKVGGFREFELLAPVEFPCGQVIPAGFKWNGASAPIMRQRAIIASCLHDYQYGRIIDRRKNGARRDECDRWRKEADFHFRQNMRKFDNQWAWLSYFFWANVRIFGGKHASTQRLNKEHINE